MKTSYLQVLAAFAIVAIILSLWAFQSTRDPIPTLTNSQIRNKGEDRSQAEVAFVSTTPELSDKDKELWKSGRFGCGGPTRNRSSNLVTVYVQNPRTGSLFLSNRFAKFSSGRFMYKTLRIKTMTPRPTKSVEDFVKEVCEVSPGYKIFVYDSGGTPNFVLKHWPPHTVLVLTGDESGRWGTYHGGRYWGPFGEDEERYFPNNESHPLRSVIYPPTIRPWFRQYYDPKQTEAFHEDALYIPLGSRSEFGDIDEADILPAPKRKYVFSLMASITDASRKQLLQYLQNTTRVPESKKFIHMAKTWHPDADHEDYVKPQKYREVMLESMFTPCPKGHSLDTFRLYEAIEAGSIPVLELKNGYAREHMPPEYFDSPMIFVESWKDAPDKMADLADDPKLLAQRQKDMMLWYKRYMRGITDRLEEILESRG